MAISCAEGEECAHNIHLQKHCIFNCYLAGVLPGFIYFYLFYIFFSIFKVSVVFLLRYLRFSGYCEGNRLKQSKKKKVMYAEDLS